MYIKKGYHTQNPKTYYLIISIKETYIIPIESKAIQKGILQAFERV